MERIVSMFIRRFAMRALRKGLNRSKTNSGGSQQAPPNDKQKQSGPPANQARGLARLVRRIGRF